LAEYAAVGRRRIDARSTARSAPWPRASPLEGISMKKLVLALPLALACACAPSINPKMQSATNGLLGASRAKHSEAAAKAFAPQGWVVGQWAMFKVVDTKEQRPAVMKISVVGKDGDAIWVETEMQDWFRHSISKMLYTKMPRSGEEAADAILKIVTKADDQPVQVLDFTSNQPGIAMMKSMMKSTFQGVFVPEVEMGKPEDVTVAAGDFKGCATMTARASVGPVKTDTRAWLHPAVPLNGIVKAEATDGSSTMELLDYGTTGAVSALP
jgi:hypothetical protein